MKYELCEKPELWSNIWLNFMLKCKQILRKNRSLFESFNSMTDSKPLKKYNFSLALNKELIRWCFTFYTQGAALCVWNTEAGNKRPPFNCIITFEDRLPADSFFNLSSSTAFIKFQKSSIVTPTKNLSLMFGQNFEM